MPGLATGAVGHSLWASHDVHARCALHPTESALPDPSLAYGRLSKINILADKPIPAERSEGPCEQSGLRGGGIAPGGTPPVDHPGVPWEIDFILIEPRNNLAFILFRAG